MVAFRLTLIFFCQIHKWVNYESMLEKCYIGKLKVPTPVQKRGREICYIDKIKVPTPVQKRGRGSAI